MARYICKYCEAKTNKANRVCQSCEEKIPLVRTIRSMLMPYYKSKKRREKMRGGRDGRSEKGI